MTQLKDEIASALARCRLTADQAKLAALQAVYGGRPLDEVDGFAEFRAEIERIAREQPVDASVIHVIQELTAGAPA